MTTDNTAKTRPTCADLVRSQADSRAEDFRNLFAAMRCAVQVDDEDTLSALSDLGVDLDDVITTEQDEDGEDGEEIRTLDEDALSDAAHTLLCEYGLCFDLVEADEDHDAYYRYQLSWGGPSDEIRFFEDGRIEYRYMDWFDGASVNVSGEDWAQDLADWFNDCESFAWSDLSPEQRWQEYHTGSEYDEE